MVVDADWAPGRVVTAENLQDLTPDKKVWTPSWGNVTLGTAPSNTGHWWEIGLTVFFTARFILGTGGDVTNTITMSWAGQLPNMDADLVDELVVTAFAQDTSGNPRISGGGIPTDQNGIARFFDNTNVGWSAAQPFDWAAGDRLRVTGFYLREP
jgi:hypothetical protein